MRSIPFLSSAALVVALAGCAPVGSESLSLGDVQDCSGVSVVVNYGILSDGLTLQCVNLLEETAVAQQVLTFAGFELEGTGTSGDQVVCRVAGLPSATEPFTVEGEEPHLESCADMPPAFAYWALWIKDGDASEWTYAQEGAGTLELQSGDSIGLAFSTGGATPLPTDP